MGTYKGMCRVEVVGCTGYLEVPGGCRLGMAILSEGMTLACPVPTLLCSVDPIS